MSRAKEIVKDGNLCTKKRINSRNLSNRRCQSYFHGHYWTSCMSPYSRYGLWPDKGRSSIFTVNPCCISLSSLPELSCVSRLIWTVPPRPLFVFLFFSKECLFPCNNASTRSSLCIVGFFWSERRINYIRSFSTSFHCLHTRRLHFGSSHIIQNTLASRAVMRNGQLEKCYL